MESKYIPLKDYHEYSPEEMKQRSAFFRMDMQRRRSVRSFSTRSVPQEVIEDCLMTAGTAPSGANMQPWHFVAVSDQQVKRQIREAAETQEYEFYHGRAGQQWLEALSGLGTDHHKPFLEEAPCLIVVFAQTYGLTADGRKVKHYYVRESVGIATGMLIAAVHNAGLVCLPYTPSKPSFLNEILDRPESEQPFLVLVVGYPADGVTVPDLRKKNLEEIATFI